MRRHWISWISLLPAGLCAHAQSSPPNILLFYVDDMGWQDTSVPFYTEVTALNRRYHTPNMERLAREGVKFTQAYASAVCSPSRVSLMTGMNAARHGVTNWTKEKNISPDERHPTLDMPRWNLNGLNTQAGVERTVVATPLAQLLRDAGYHTIHVGKAHFGARGTPGEDPKNLGFDVNIAGHAPGGPGSYWGLKNFSAAWRTNPPDHSWDVPGLEKYHGQDIYLTEALTLEALHELETAVAAKKPFYLYMAHYAVHAPFEKDTRFYQKYRDAGLNEHQSIYASMLEGMDKSLGDLLDTLKRLGVEKNTIVIFASDNGSPQENDRNWPLRGHKVRPYEGGTRVPMIVRWPGVTQPNSVCTEPVVPEDFLPSIMEMAGTTARGRVTQPLDGASIVPLLRGASPAVPANRPLVWHYPHYYTQEPFSSIRLGPWKLIYFHADSRFELYNLNEDISESKNRFAEQPEKARELAELLTRLLKERGALMPTVRKTGQPVPWPSDALKPR